MLKDHHSIELLGIVNNISKKLYHRELRIVLTLVFTAILLLLASFNILDPDIILLSLVCLHLISTLVTEHSHNKRLLRLNLALQRTTNVLVNASQEEMNSK